jgi:hypothetical protein
VDKGANVFGDNLDAVEMHETADDRAKKMMYLLTSRSWNMRRHGACPQQFVLSVGIAKENM